MLPNKSLQHCQEQMIRAIIFLLQVLELLIKKMPLGLKIGIYNVKVFQVFLKEKYISIFITLLLIIK